MTRRRFLLGCLVVAALVAAAVGFVPAPRSPVTRANVDCVRGLSIAEVQALFGSSGSEFPGDDVELRELIRQTGLSYSDVDSALHFDDEGRTATVFFGPDRQTLGAAYVDRRTTGVIPRLWRLLGL